MLLCLRLSYYDRITDNRIRCRVHYLLFDTSPIEVDETYRTGHGSICVGNTGLRCIYGVRIWCFEPVKRINNNMKTRDDMIKEHYMTTPQGREPFHPRKQTGPMASFMSIFHHERNLENKDRGLTSSSGCAPVDAPPC